MGKKLTRKELIEYNSKYEQGAEVGKRKVWRRKLKPSERRKIVGQAVQVGLHSLLLRK